jgi:hypothetical protein
MSCKNFLYTSKNLPYFPFKTRAGKERESKKLLKKTFHKIRYFFFRGSEKRLKLRGGVGVYKKNQVERNFFKVSKTL